MSLWKSYDSFYHRYDEFMNNLPYKDSVTQCVKIQKAPDERHIMY